MNPEEKGGWTYIMANRYRGTIYTGVTADLTRRAAEHRAGTGSDFCARHALTRLVWAEHANDITDCIAQEKRIKRWRREWKFALIENTNPEWADLLEIGDCCEAEAEWDPGSSPG